MLLVNNSLDIQLCLLDSGMQFGIFANNIKQECVLPEYFPASRGSFS